MQYYPYNEVPEFIANVVYCFILHLPFPNPKRLCLLRLVLCLSLLPLAVGLEWLQVLSVMNLLDGSFLATIVS